MGILKDYKAIQVGVWRIFSQQQRKYTHLQHKLSGGPNAPMEHWGFISYEKRMISFAESNVTLQ